MNRHPRAGVTHDRARLFALLGLVAVDRAVGTGGLVFAKSATFDANFRILEKCPALGTQSRFAAAVKSRAVQPGHRPKGIELALEASTAGIHSDLYYSLSGGGCQLT